MSVNPFASPSNSKCNGITYRGTQFSDKGDFQFPSPSPTLRDEAAQRAARMSNSQQLHLSRVISPHPLIYSSPAATMLGSPNMAITVTNKSSSSQSLASSARKEWRNHGSGMTQAMEELRRRDEERPGTLTVRLVSAETRRDITGKKYIAYVLKVKLVNNQILQLQHRYSEFAKLNDSFKNHGVSLQATFPAKNIAGRLGNWTPSLRWAPEQHDDLVQYRKVQLDIWLVSVLEKFNIGDLPYSLARQVYEFLTLSDRPPCDMENATTDASMLRWMNPISFTMGSSIRQACRSVEDMCLSQKMFGGSNGGGLQDTDQSIPLDLLHCAKGLIFLTVAKAGLVVSGRVGTGLLIARVDNPQQWTAPCALGTIGMGWGVLAGVDVTHYLVVLTRQEAVETVLSGTVQLGTELGVAVGPVGRTTQIATSPDHAGWTLYPAYSYAHSKGLFMGLSLEGSLLTTRSDVNAKFYGRSGLTGEQVLDLPPPKAALPLYALLDQALATEIPKDGFRPSHLFQEKGNTSSSASSTGSSSVVTSSDLFGPP